MGESDITLGLYGLGPYQEKNESFLYHLELIKERLKDLGQKFGEKVQIKKIA